MAFVCRCEGLGWNEFVGFEHARIGLGRSGGIGEGGEGGGVRYEDGDWTVERSI
jgi:hypothetical protein